VPVGARVMVTFLKDDGHVAGKSEPFAEGWNDNGYYLGRPVDVAQLPMVRCWSRMISSERSIASGTTVVTSRSEMMAHDAGPSCLPWRKIPEV